MNPFGWEQSFSVASFLIFYELQQGYIIRISVWVGVSLLDAKIILLKKIETEMLHFFQYQKMNN